MALPLLHFPSGNFLRPPPSLLPLHRTYLSTCVSSRSGGGKSSLAFVSRTPFLRLNFFAPFPARFFASSSSWGRGKAKREGGGDRRCLVRVAREEREGVRPRGRKKVSSYWLRRVPYLAEDGAGGGGSSSSHPTSNCVSLFLSLSVRHKQREGERAKQREADFLVLSSSSFRVGWSDGGVLSSHKK